MADLMPKKGANGSPGWQELFADYLTGKGYHVDLPQIFPNEQSPNNKAWRFDCYIWPQNGDPNYWGLSGSHLHIVGRDPAAQKLWDNALMQGKNYKPDAEDNPLWRHNRRKDWIDFYRAQLTLREGELNGEKIQPPLLPEYAPGDDVANELYHVNVEPLYPFEASLTPERFNAICQMWRGRQSTRWTAQWEANSGAAYQEAWVNLLNEVKISMDKMFSW